VNPSTVVEKGREHFWRSLSLLSKFCPFALLLSGHHFIRYAKKVVAYLDCELAKLRIGESADEPRRKVAVAPQVAEPEPQT